MLLDTLRSVCNVVVTKLALYTGIAVLALACTWILYRAFYRLVWSGHVSVRDSEGRPRHVLVTGCDSGFGNGLARQLHAKGFHVHAGCLFQKSATALEGELGDRCVPPPYAALGRFLGNHNRAHHQSRPSLSACGQPCTVLHAAGVRHGTPWLAEMSHTEHVAALATRLHGLHLDVTSDRDVQLALENPDWNERDAWKT